MYILTNQLLGICMSGRELLLGFMELWTLGKATYDICNASLCYIEIAGLVQHGVCVVSMITTMFGFRLDFVIPSSVH